MVKRSRLNLVGQRFGRLVVTKALGLRAGGTWFECRCDCGNTYQQRGALLKYKIKSCGQCSVRMYGKRVQRMKEYQAWCEMKKRCYNKNHKFYANYGGRGITVCPRWKNSFLHFFSDMGRKPSDRHSLDRLDNSKGYSPENCRWSTKTEQARNKRNVPLISFGGESMCLQGWAERLGVRKTVIWNRLNKLGWTVEQALTIPAKGYHKKVALVLCGALLLMASGCSIALGGSQVNNEVVFVEAGSVCRVATDKKIKVVAVTDEGKQVVVEKNIAGMVVLPKSVYDELRAEWLKSHPNKSATLVPKNIPNMATEEVPTDPPLVDENADHTAWVEAKEK